MKNFDWKGWSWPLFCALLVLIYWRLSGWL
jgi:hypothetical protein